MVEALAAATRALGQVWPNPAVGCNIIKDGQSIALGFTQPGGRPHAEAMALEAAGAEGVEGATAYVTLEPCAHQGETPSCARLLAEAGIAKVFYAVQDPDPRTAGQGAAYLESQGVEVDVGLFEREAIRINQGFLMKILKNRPMVTLKMAVSKDGKIAEAEGVRTAITGDLTNQFTHKLRAKYDAILVGVGTVLADNPSLTCRLPGLEGMSPVRIILDRTLKTPPKSALMKSLKVAPLWIVTEAEHIPFKFQQKGVEIIQVDDISNLREVIEKIGEFGITRLFVEGGATVNASFYEAGLIDYMFVLRNPELELGDEGVPAFRGKDVFRGDKIVGFQGLERNEIEQDIIDFYGRTD